MNARQPSRRAPGCAGSSPRSPRIPRPAAALAVRRLAPRLLEEPPDQLACFLRLLLLDPVPGALHEVAAEHPGAGGRLHALELAGFLVDPPVALPRDEARRHVDRPAGERLQLGGVPAARRAPVPLQPALEAGAAELCAVHLQLFVG